MPLWRGVRGRAPFCEWIGGLMNSMHPERHIPGWAGHISRIEAEHRLEGQAVGTFVLRDGDDLNDRILSALQRSNREHLESCLLTVVASEGKISEYLIVHTPEGWTLYQDNPDLRDHSQYKFSHTLDELLTKISSIAKRPLHPR